jgi:hypothetical protein
MSLFKTITYLTPLSILLTVIFSTLLISQSELSGAIALITFFVFYISIILSADLLLIRYANTTKDNLKTIIIYMSIGLMTFASLTIFDIIAFSNLWHILLGITIVFLLIIQLNILGWSQEKHSLILKLAFFIVLISNLFLATVFLFKIDFYTFKPILIGTTITSVLFLLVGVINTPKEA